MKPPLQEFRLLLQLLFQRIILRNRTLVHEFQAGFFYLNEFPRRVRIQPQSLAVSIETTHSGRDCTAHLLNNLLQFRLLRRAQVRFPLQFVVAVEQRGHVALQVAHLRPLLVEGIRGRFRRVKERRNAVRDTAEGFAHVAQRREYARKHRQQRIRQPLLQVGELRVQFSHPAHVRVCPVGVGSLSVCALLRNQLQRRCSLRLLKGLAGGLLHPVHLQPPLHVVLANGNAQAFQFFTFAQQCFGQCVAHLLRGFLSTRPLAQCAAQVHEARADVGGSLPLKAHRDEQVRRAGRGGDIFSRREAHSRRVSLCGQRHAVERRPQHRLCLVRQCLLLEGRVGQFLAHIEHPRAELHDGPHREHLRSQPHHLAAVRRHLRVGGSDAPQRLLVLGKYWLGLLDFFQGGVVLLRTDLGLFEIGSPQPHLLLQRDNTALRFLRIEQDAYSAANVFHIT